MCFSCIYETFFLKSQCRKFESSLISTHFNDFISVPYSMEPHTQHAVCREISACSQNYSTKLCVESYSGFCHDCTPAPTADFYSKILCNHLQICIQEPVHPLTEIDVIVLLFRDQRIQEHLFLMSTPTDIIIDDERRSLVYVIFSFATIRIYTGLLEVE